MMPGATTPVFQSLHEACVDAAAAAAAAGLPQDGVAMLWDLAEGKRLYSLDAGDIIHALVFSPNRYWLCAATQVRAWRFFLGGGGILVTCLCLSAACQQVAMGLARSDSTLVWHAVTS
jgi:hypothetical protein